jgi:integrase
MTTKKGAGRLYRRGKVWWLRFGYRGRDIRESSGSAREADARRLLAHRLGEIGRGAFLGPDEARVTMDDLFDALVVDYEVNRRRSLGMVRAQLAELRPVFGAERARDLTAARIERFSRDCLADGMQPATVNRRLATIRRAFRIALRQERLGRMPRITLLAEHNTRQGFVDPPAFERIVGQLPADLHDVARFAYATGWRKGEITTLAWADVDRDGARILLRSEHSKNAEPRILPLVGELAALIERRWQARAVLGPDGRTTLAALVFHRAGRPVGNIRKAWASACRRAGVSGLLFHDLRRSAVRNFEKAGVRPSVAMKLSGHKTDSVYRRYRIVDESDLTDALARTQQHTGARGPGTVTPLR